jgi:signal transduction histidine kinase
MKEVRQRAEAYETGRAQLLHLAGVGLLVEVLAHELNRATAHALNTLNDIRRQDAPDYPVRVFSTLEAQLRSLQKRLRTLDPLSTRGRQVKETFDLVAWIQGALVAHQAQFHRHDIHVRFRTKPEKGAKLEIHAVKGMIVQVLENLISNSVYWLKQERKLDPSFKPEIQVTIDILAKQVRFSDNGPGIEPERQELVFEAFHSTKPPGTGSGLGLFIAREIAEYHNTSLYLEPTPSGPQKTFHTFVFDLQPVQRVQSGGAG